MNMKEKSLKKDDCNPLVSIIMPVYNIERHLRESIKDIISQTYDRWELICIEDGSTDASLCVLEYFAERDNRIHIISQENKGSAISRNRGIREAKGKYLIFLDGDDRFEPALLDEAVREAEYTNADIVIFDGFAFDDATGAIFDNIVILNADIAPKQIFSARDTDKIFQISSACPWNKLYRRNFIIEKRLEYKSAPYMNDVFFTSMSMVLAERISVLNKRLIAYRRGNASSISKASNKMKKPEVCFSVMTQLQEGLEKVGCCESVRKSFAKYALERIMSQITEVLNENTLEVFERFLGENIFQNYWIDELKEEDFEWSENYSDICAYYRGGVNLLLARLFHRYAFFFLENTYGITNEKQERKITYFFDVGRIPLRSKVILYGAGTRGKACYKKNQLSKQYDIVLWVDKNARKLEGGHGMLSEPNSIKDVEFDYIFIAIDNFKIAKEVMDNLSVSIPIRKILL